MDLGQYDRALEYYQQALAISQRGQGLLWRGAIFE